MCTGWPTTAMPKPSFFEWTSLQPFHGDDVVTCFDVVGCRVRWSNVVGCEVTWDGVMWLVARCHVMSCDVMLCHVIWCDVISCVVFCHVMQCDVMWCVLMWWASSVVNWCGAMGCDLMSLWWDVTGCDVTLCGSKWLFRAVKWKMSWWSVLQSTASTTQYYKVLQGTTQYYSSTTLYYNATKYYSSTTKYYSSTTKYYSSTTCTKYYSSTTKYYSVLQSTTPVLLLTLRGATGVIVQSHRILSLPRKVTLVIDARRIYETSFTMREATGVINQRHQVLCLPRKMTRIIDPHDISNVSYNAQSNRIHPPTSPNIAPAMKNDSHDWSSSQMKRHLQCAEQ